MSFKPFFRFLGKLIAPIVTKAMESEANQQKLREAATKAADRAVQAALRSIKK